jgi:predicted HAD superfamily Cof-like phosphohydrolase
MKEPMSNFSRVSKMNVAFGNPKGDPHTIDFDRVRKQCLNLVDELGELFVALGANPASVKYYVSNLKHAASVSSQPVDVDGIRDALCDLHVFAYGAHHFMGIDADKDMDAVVDGVMTRFVKDIHDMEATIKLHAAKGVTATYIEGEFPTAVLKSAKDQPDAPAGKFLKSVSYSDTIFPAI